MDGDGVRGRGRCVNACLFRDKRTVRNGFVLRGHLLRLVPGVLAWPKSIT
jgi:hypothetical protein